MVARNDERPATDSTVSEARKFAGTGNAGTFKSNPNISQETQRLYIGGRLTGVTVERDRAHPAMWRVRCGDEQSDMVNFSRARDAAMTWTRPRGLGGGEVARWGRRETRPTARHAEKNGVGHVGVAAGEFGAILPRLAP